MAPLKPSASFHIFSKEILRAPGAQVYVLSQLCCMIGHFCLPNCVVIADSETKQLLMRF
jgi:hypothetical protein